MKKRTKKQSLKTKKMPFYVLTMQFKVTTPQQAKELSKELQTTFSNCIFRWQNPSKLPRNWGKVKDPITGKSFVF